MTNEPKYPNVVVKLVGENGNAFAILGRVQRAMRRAGVPREEIKTYLDDARMGDYDHLLATTCKWVNVI